MHAKRSSGGRRYGSQRGFSLVELLIAMVLGLIVVAGLIQVLLANRKAYQLQEGNNFLQQNLRFASDRIGWSLRMADFWGGAAGNDVTGAGTAKGGVTAGGGDCSKDWIVAVDTTTTGGGGVFGYDGDSSFPLGACVNASDYVKGSDVLVVRYAGTEALNPAKPASIAAAGSAVNLVATVGRQAGLFAGTTVPQLSTSPPPLRYVFPYNIEMYYLRPCSDVGSNSKCDADDDNGSPIPTLMRMRLDSAGKLVSDPMVEGIEQLQFQYGVGNGTGQNLYPEKYVSAGAVSNWAQVVSVRIDMVARSRQRDVAVPHTGTFALTPGCSYTIANGGAVTATTTDCTGFSLSALDRPDQFPRSLMQQVVQIRNRTRG